MTREKALSRIQQLTLDEFSEKFLHLNLTKSRTRQFHDVVTGKLIIRGHSQFDIQEFALKTIFNKVYKDFKTDSHLYSTGDLYEFDPAKNGQNLVKHGVGFGEVAHYSRRFGTLNIHCPDSNDSQRIVSFSDLDLENKYKLELPLSKIESPSYCISILKSTDGKFRFISSRLLSSKKKKYMETIYQSLRSVNFSDETSKAAFVDLAVEILESNLIGH